MNIEEITNDLKNKLDELILSFEKLKNTIEAEKVKEWRDNLDKKRWSGNYYYIEINGDIILTTDTGTGLDNWNYKTGNYFKTKEEAERLKILFEVEK
jgi:hypothetical protein